MQQWDEIVYAFCMGIPAKRRRRRLKVYEDCFTGRKAVDWMHNYLMFSSYFCKHEVSRFQAVQLLRKFMHHSIIQRVDIKDPDQDPAALEFKDNRDLYTLCPSIAQVLPIHQPIPDDVEIGNVSMDLEADPVPPVPASSSSSSLSSSSCLPTYEQRYAAAVSYSPAAVARPTPSVLNCCASGSASATMTATTATTMGTRTLTAMTRSPLKPVNRSQSSVTAVARLRRVPDDVFWL